MEATPKWGRTAEVTPNCFIVRDANGQQLAYVYYESEPGRRSAAKLLTKDEARRIAINFAKPPDLLLGIKSPRLRMIVAQRYGTTVTTPSFSE